MFYKKLLMVLFFIVMLFCMGVVNASDIDDNVTEIEINNDYVENTSSGQIIIEDCLSANQNTNIDYYSLIIWDENYTIINGFNNSISSNLPNYYFNNNIYSHIENQGDGGNCWAFAAISTLESNILKINQSLNYDFSENNMKNLMSNSSNYGIFNYAVNQGGFDSMAIGYLTSWLGPVLESDDPYDLSSTNINLFNSTIHVQNVLFVKNNISNIKEAIFNYGAVALSYKHDGSYYNHATFSYFSQQSNITNNGHAVSIIGWDDNFPKENFIYQPPSNGAFICKNSWGESFGDNGLFYISYYDYYLQNQLNLGTYTFILNDTTHYNRNYQYDSLSSQANVNTSELWIKNDFCSEGNDLLSAVSTYFYEENDDYLIEIFVNDVSILNQSGFMSNKGYYTILLDNPISLTIGDNFTVSIKLSNNNSIVHFGLCRDVMLTMIHHPNNVSSYSRDGIIWNDLTNYPNSSVKGVACIKAFTVHNPLNTSLILNIGDDINLFDNVNISARVIDSNNNSVLKGEVTFIIGNDVYVVSLINGYANVTVCFENAGNITINAYFNDYDYNPSQYTKNILINKSNVNMSCYYSYDETFNCTIVNVLFSSEHIDTTVNLIVNNHNYPISIGEGVGFIQLPGQVNFNNNSYVQFNGNNNFNPTNTSNILFKNNISHEIYRTYDIEMYYHNGTRFVVTLMNNGQAIVGKNVTISINGVNYTKITNESGAVSIALELNSGIYNVTTSYVDENNHVVIIRNIVTICATIISQDLIKIHRNASQFEATFLDLQGNPLQYASVTFNINGVLYNKTTNDVGIAGLNINLSPGEYIITSINPINGEMASNNIIVLSRIIENNNLIKYYKNDSQYIVKILDDFGNPVGAGENVTFNINGMLYTHQTNSSGHVKLNINLSPGVYIVTAEYLGCMVSNTITVLPVLYANDLTKRYGDTTPFSVYLVDSIGNPYPNQQVTFNINGVFYNKFTDENGIARLNINLGPGQYVITSSFNGSNIANNIIITT